MREALFIYLIGTHLIPYSCRLWPLGLCLGGGGRYLTPNKLYTLCSGWLDSYYCNRPYAYDVTEGRPAALGVKRNTATCVIAKHAARRANPASHTAGLARPGPRTERLSANAHCQHNTCALRDTRLASLLWRCDPLWRQCIKSIVK